ncbi:MAG TPA: tetratricopeptide repeat protein, partial [Actinomycetota bacterium]|nr:tetratricopeptide repeat protein [Actinomycetota bacterium]
RLYQQLLALDPENKFAYYNLGLIDQTQGRTDAAAANYTEALTIDPGFRASAVHPGDHPSRPGLVRRGHRALPPHPGGEPR